jgi:hypothetical protein
MYRINRSRHGGRKGTLCWDCRILPPYLFLSVGSGDTRLYTGSEEGGIDVLDVNGMGGILGVLDTRLVWGPGRWRWLWRALWHRTFIGNVAGDLERGDAAICNKSSIEFGLLVYWAQIYSIHL